MEHINTSGDETAAKRLSLRYHTLLGSDTVDVFDRRKTRKIGHYRFATHHGHRIRGSWYIYLMGDPFEQGVNGNEAEVRRTLRRTIAKRRATEGCGAQS